MLENTIKKIDTIYDEVLNGDIHEQDLLTELMFIGEQLRLLDKYLESLNLEIN